MKKEKGREGEGREDEARKVDWLDREGACSSLCSFLLPFLRA